MIRRIRKGSNKNSGDMQESSKKPGPSYNETREKEVEKSGEIIELEESAI